jgi:hypothetical protein
VRGVIFDKSSSAEREARLLAQLERHRRRTRPADRRFVDREARVRVDDLRARLAEQQHGVEQRRLAAGTMITWSGCTLPLWKRVA